MAFLSHCGSRGLGYNLASGQFRTLQQKFETWSIPLPGGDRELVYAPLGTPEADDYLDDMALGGNFATVNHLLINALVLEAFQEVIPGVTGQLVYFISHNIARKEVVDNRLAWVHRKGATRAFPAGHHALKDTPFADTGHPILLPGNPQAGSVVMVADEGAVKSCYSVNHGAGRQMGRKEAIRQLDQKTIDNQFDADDILTNCRQYPKDEAPAAYKDFDEVRPLGHRRRPGQRSGPAPGEVRDQGCEQGRRLTSTDPLAASQRFTMKEPILTIDGSQGEGGGQVLRSSLAMSLVTGRPFVIENIRAGRKKPGLMRQHLTAVNAAAEVSHAEVDRGRDRLLAAGVSAGQGRVGQLHVQRRHGRQHDPRAANRVAGAAAGRGRVEPDPRRRHAQPVRPAAGFPDEEPIFRW